MRKQILQLSFFCALLVFVGCTNEPADREEIGLDQSAMSEELTELIKKEQLKQIEIIKSHYKTLSNGRESELTVEEYYYELAVNYQDFTEKALLKFNEMSESGADPGKIEQMREDLRLEMGIPDWYWEMKEASNELIREAALQ